LTPIGNEDFTGAAIARW